MEKRQHWLKRTRWIEMSKWLCDFDRMQKNSSVAKSMKHLSLAWWKSKKTTK